MTKINIIISIIFLTLFSATIYAQEKVIVISKSSQNDYQNFEKLLNDSYPGPLKILVKAGNYRLSRAVRIDRSKVTLDFEPNANVNFTSNNAGIIISGDNCKIINGNFIGNGVSSKDIYSGYGILLAGSNNSVISNNSFKKISGIPIFIARSSAGKGSSSNVISNNNISQSAINPKNDGDEAAILIGYSGNNYFHVDNVIKNNVIDGNNNLNIGIGLIGHGKNNTIMNNSIKNCKSYGIIAYESDYTEKSLFNTSIEGNTIQNIGRIDGGKTKKGMGIYLMKSQNSKVINNKISNTLLGNDKSETLGSGAITLNGSINSVVSSNIITKSQMYGISNAFSFNTSIENNTINDINKSAIYLINVGDVILKNNKINNSKETVFKGFFENTSLNYIKKTWKFSKYQDINTGNNIIIENNRISNSNHIINFVSNGPNKSYKGQNYRGNKLNNNTFRSNIVNSKTYNVDERTKNVNGIK